LLFLEEEEVWLKSLFPSSTISSFEIPFEKIKKANNHDFNNNNKEKLGQ